MQFRRWAVAAPRSAWTVPGDTKGVVSLPRVGTVGCAEHCDRLVYGSECPSLETMLRSL